MLKEQITKKLQNLTKKKYVEILTRGNAAIYSALKAAKQEVLIPEDGGWITYQQYPKKLKLKLTEVKTKNAILNLKDLDQKSKRANLLLYHQPGGYFAEQPTKKIYEICKKNKCLVVMDISGGIGTRLYRPHADIVIGSFGRWKLIDAKGGGFLATNNKTLFQKIQSSFKILDNKTKLQTINKKINNLPNRIDFLLQRRKQVLQDLKDYNILYRTHLGFVIVVKYRSSSEKEKLISYCQTHQLDYTECPRYIRVNQKAISIEIKRL